MGHDKDCFVILKCIYYIFTFKHETTRVQCCRNV